MSVGHVFTFIFLGVVYSPLSHPRQLRHWWLAAQLCIKYAARDQRSMACLHQHTLVQEKLFFSVPQKFFQVGKTSTFCLSFLGFCRFNANGCSQNAWPFLLYKENPHATSTVKKCASLATTARYFAIIHTMACVQIFKAGHFFTKKHCQRIRNHKMWLYFT